MSTAVPNKMPSRFLRLMGLKRVLALNVTIFLMLVWGLYGEVLRNDDMQDEIDRLQVEADELAAKNSELAEFGQRLTDPQVLEKEARLKLNMQKPGEEVVVVRDAHAIAVAEGEAEARKDEERGPQLSNPQKWWRYFFR